MSNALQETPNYLTAAFYLFVELPNYVDRRAALLAFCEAHNVKGSILLASEGINGTIAGAAKAAFKRVIAAGIEDDHAQPCRAQLLKYLIDVDCFAAGR